jgi:hypothetical protein
MVMMWTKEDILWDTRRAACCDGLGALVLSPPLIRQRKSHPARLRASPVQEDLKITDVLSQGVAN